MKEVNAVIYSDGIVIDDRRYWHDDMCLHLGCTVFCRMADDGKIGVWKAAPALGGYYNICTLDDSNLVGN